VSFLSLPPLQLGSVSDFFSEPLFRVFSGDFERVLSFGSVFVECLGVSVFPDLRFDASSGMLGVWRKEKDWIRVV
jgi:hypothetical protein